MFTRARDRRRGAYDRGEAGRSARDLRFDGDRRTCRRLLPDQRAPAGLEAIAKALPFTWTIDVFRDALLGGDVSQTQVALLVVCGTLALPLSIALFDYSVNYAKRQGSLAQY